VRPSVRPASGAGSRTTTLTEPEPNIDADPLFVEALAGNSQLIDGSPAIDASYSPRPSSPTSRPTDLLGAPRIQERDRGARHGRVRAPRMAEANANVGYRHVSGGA